MKYFIISTFFIVTSLFAFEQIELIQRDNGISVSFEFDDQDRLCKIYASDGSIAQSIVYHQDSRVVFDQLSGESLTQFFDHEGRLIKEIFPSGLNITFSYDEGGHLIAYALPNEGEVHYEYVGNDLDVVTLSHPFGQEIRLSGNPDFSGFPSGPEYSIESKERAICIYDELGRVVRKEGVDGTIAFTYDALDRLKVVTTPDRTMHYTHDDVGRRLTKTITSAANFKTEHYIYLGLNEIAIYDDHQQQITHRILGNSFHEEVPIALAIEFDGECYIPKYNPDLNISELYKTHTHEVTACETLSAFGDQLQDKPVNPWVYRAKHFDPHAQLVFYRYRVYDPQMHQWLTPDPLSSGNIDDLYTFNNDDPSAFFDPDGRAAIAIPLINIAFGAGAAIVSSPLLVPAAAISAAAAGGAYLYSKYKTDQDNQDQKKKEFKKPKPKTSGKDGAKDAPSWAKGQKPYKDESGKEYAKRLMEERYGQGNYKTGPDSEYNKLKKYGDRAFE